MISDSINFFVSTISFTDFELDIVLDIEGSVEATQRYHNIVCYSDGMNLRRINEPATYALIAGQDLIALQVFLPDFVRVIQGAGDADLSEIGGRGKMSLALKNYSHAFHHQGRKYLENRIQLLQDCSVAESYLGRILFYRHKDEYILEVDKFGEPAMTLFDVVSPQKLISALQKTDRLFHEIISDHIGKRIKKQSEYPDCQ
jgi:hypothetical protein